MNRVTARSMIASVRILKTVPREYERTNVTPHGRPIDSIVTPDDCIDALDEAACARPEDPHHRADIPSCHADVSRVVNP